MKDSGYYISLMRDRARALHDELTAGLTARQMMEMEDELEERTFMPRLEAEVGRGLPEARSIIEALENAGDEAVELVWVVIYPGYDAGKLGHARLTRPEMIARLEEIASLEIGDDLEEWRTWLAAFEADPPPLGYH